MIKNMYGKLVVLRRACKDQMYLSLFGFLAILILPVFFLATLEKGVGLWFSIGSWIGACIGFLVMMRGPGNPLAMRTWGILPYGRLLLDKEFSRKAESYGKKIYSETNLLPVRILLLLMPLAFLLLSLDSAAVNLYLLASIFGGLMYSIVVVCLVDLPVLYKARSRYRISQFFKVSESRLMQLEQEKPKMLLRPQSVTYISIPFLAVGVVGIAASVFLMIGGVFQIQSITQLIQPYNPFGFGIFVIPISILILLMWRGLLQMKQEWALLAGVLAACVVFLSLLTLVGGVLRSFLVPSALPFLSPFSATILLLGLSISIPVLWVIKKNWKKFERGGLRHYTTLRDISENEKVKRKK